VAIDLDRFDALTFDCYGTLIDWETGLLAALRPVLESHGADAGDEELLELYGRHEAQIEAGPYARYADVLAGALDRVGADLGFEPSAEERAAFSRSVADWPPFEDSTAALASLAERYWLGVVTNCDDDLFAASAAKLGAEFHCVVTAEQAGAYKPDHRGFELAFERLGLPRERVLHVAQSRFHDHVPAKALGLSTVWVDRRGARPGPGATPEAVAEPDLTVASVGELAYLARG
jgi:2-haloacid dehalogenase